MLLHLMASGVVAQIRMTPANAAAGGIGEAPCLKKRDHSGKPSARFVKILSYPESEILLIRYRRDQGLPAFTGVP
jgi:hypothetical protein